MNVTVLFFASLKELAGTSVAEVQIRGKAKVGTVFELLKAKYPRLREYQAPLMIAVNEEYGDLNSPVAPGDEIAFFPPVSGGCR